jgi:hypothetical protein
VLQILKISDVTHCGVRTEISHFPKEGEISAIFGWPCIIDINDTE